MVNLTVKTKKKHSTGKIKAKYSSLDTENIVTGFSNAFAMVIGNHVFSYFINIGTKFVELYLEK